MTASPAAHRVVAATLFVLVGSIYIASAARHLLGGDNGEFSTLMAVGGVAHPSGYPLYTLLLRAFRWLPGVSPAHSASLVTALIGVGAVVAVRASCRAWGASPGASTTVAALIGLSALMWKLSTHAEVFALHALLAACIVATSGASSTVVGVRRAILLGLLAGLGLSNNHSLVLLAPLGLLGVVRAVREHGGALRPLAATIAGLALGLLPYLHLVLEARRADARSVWGEASTLDGLVHHFLRGDYGTTSLAISDSTTTGAEHVARLLGHLGVELHFVGAVVVLVGVFTMLGRGRGGVSPPGAVRRLDGWVWLVTFVVAGPLFVARFNLPLHGLALHVVERFYLLPLVLSAVPLAIGIDRVAGRALERVDVLGSVVVAALSASVIVGYEEVTDHHRPDVYYYVLNSLDSADEGAVILGTGDHRLYGFRYAQLALGLRPDVTYVDVNLLRYPWYARRLEREVGHTIQGVAKGATDTRLVAASFLEQERPLYVTNRFSGAIVSAYATYPIGTLIRVLPPGFTAPEPRDLEELNLVLASGFRYHDSEPRSRTGWGAHVQADHTRPWQVLADTYTRMGLHEDAERCRSRGLVLHFNTRREHR